MSNIEKNPNRQFSEEYLSAKRLKTEEHLRAYNVIAKEVQNKSELKRELTASDGRVRLLRNRIYDLIGLKRNGFAIEGEPESVLDATEGELDQGVIEDENVTDERKKSSELRGEKSEEKGAISSAIFTKEGVSSKMAAISVKDVEDALYRFDGSSSEVKLWL